MTKFCDTRFSKTRYGNLKTGDCFYDENNLFCIKIDDSSCLFFKDDTWTLFKDCAVYDEVYPVDAEIHIVS